jgi:hypothetical protein
MLRGQAGNHDFPNTSGLKLLLQRSADECAVHILGDYGLSILGRDQGVMTESRFRGVQRAVGILRSVLNVEDGAFRGAPGEEKPSRVLLSVRVVPGTPLGVVEAGLNVD